tara:strand:- start:319 stop:753 length:435 start_codon:yes stop_codon:yes gene_type:complete
MANGILNGTDLKVYDGTTLIAYATNATININHSPRSISNKESSGWEENMEGMRNWDVSVDAMYAWLDSGGSAIGGKTLSELFTAYIHTRASFSITFGVTSTGTEDTKYAGTVWMTSASLTAPLEDSATYSASFQGSGALTQTIS